MKNIIILLQVCFVSKDGRMETCSCENKHCGCEARKPKETKAESPRRAEPKISSRTQNKPSKPIRTRTTPKTTSVIQKKPNNSAASSRGNILSCSLLSPFILKHSYISYIVFICAKYQFHRTM